MLSSLLVHRQSPPSGKRGTAARAPLASQFDLLDLVHLHSLAPRPSANACVPSKGVCTLFTHGTAKDLEGNETPNTNRREVKSAREAEKQGR